MVQIFKPSLAGYISDYVAEAAGKRLPGMEAVIEDAMTDHGYTCLTIEQSVAAAICDITDQPVDTAAEAIGKAEADYRRTDMDVLVRRGLVFKWYDGDGAASYAVRKDAPEPTDPATSMVMKHMKAEDAVVISAKDMAAIKTAVESVCRAIGIDTEDVKNALTEHLVQGYCSIPDVMRVKSMDDARARCLLTGKMCGRGFSRMATL